MQLALGTVQFGAAYGIAGRQEAVPEDEVRSILARAFELGIRTLDTAAAYGDIEQRLARLCGEFNFRIVSKIKPVPDGLSSEDRSGWLIAEANASLQRLGERLDSIMLHRADDLLSASGENLWQALSKWGRVHSISVGASCYEPATAVELHRRFDIQVTQLPGNAFDQRIIEAMGERPDFAVHLRSAFLQGLLLMDRDKAVKSVPESALPLENWRQWCLAHGLSQLQAALCVVKSFPAVTTCVVGVDNLGQLEEIAHAWAEARAIAAPELSCADLRLIDPRLWRKL